MKSQPTMVKDSIVPSTINHSLSIEFLAAVGKRILEESIENKPTLVIIPYAAGLREDMRHVYEIFDFTSHINQA